MLLLALHIPQPHTPLQFCCPTSPKGAPGAFVENVAACYTPSTTFRGTLCCRVWTKGYSNTPPAQDPDWLTPWGHSKPSRCHNTADAQSAKLLGSLLPSFVVPGRAAKNPNSSQANSNNLQSKQRLWREMLFRLKHQKSTLGKCF